MSKKKSKEERQANRMTPEQIANTPADRVRSFGMAYWNPRSQRRRRYGRPRDSRCHKFGAKQIALHAQNLRGPSTPFWTETRLKKYAELGDDYWDKRWQN